MRPFLPLLLAAVPVIQAAAAPNPPGDKVAALSLLPDGSELQRVMFPRYDENQRLVGVLMAEAMTLVDENSIAGRTIAIEFFNPDQTPRGRIDLVEASVDQAKGMIKARERVTLQSDRLNARGTGLHYSFEEGRGFLTGPAETWIQHSTETTMQSKSSPLRAAAIGAVLAAQPAVGDPAVPAGPAPSALESAVASRADEVSAANRATRKDLSAALDASNAANAAAKDFLEKAGLADSAPASKTPEPPQAKPLDVKPGPQDTMISCDGGMFFNPDEGVFVYLGNVRVTDPRFTMSGANELKVFLGKKESAKGGTEKPGEASDVAGKFGEVERIVATGAIVIDQKSVAGKEPIKASGAVFSYNVKDDQVILSGGYPWVVQGGIALRAREPNLTLRIHPKAGRFDTEGGWDTILPLQQLQNRQP